jgi:simple sugar transport system ATP-binding protein
VREPTPLLRIEGLVVTDDDGNRRVDEVDLDVGRGEIVGVAGVAGNGQRELAEAVAGLRTPASGRVDVDGVDVTGRGPRAARAAGLAFVPEDRLGTGLSPSLSITENLLLTRPTRFLVNRRRAASQARDVIERFDIKAPGADAPTRVLSGGNAQKVLLARELSGGARVLVAASPTRGLDVGAIEVVRDLLDRFRADGGAVLLLSEDLDEVLSLSDRIVVLYRGAIVHRTSGDDADIEQLGYAMAGLT